ncbi:MAG: ferredoxin [Nanoarchaeota archaeon]|nr:ferredoxin [Nanoarchaeota archaeon]
MPKVKINESECIGCGTCAALASDIFEMSSEGVAMVMQETPDDMEKVKEVIDSCPVKVISVEG